MARKKAVVAPDAGALESLARAALLEIIPAASVGVFVETRPTAEPGITDVVFEQTDPGYVGWSWVVTTAEVHDAVTGELCPPTVVELGLLPGDDALLAPEWVPWSVRLAEWNAQQAALAAEAGEDEADEPDDGDGIDEAELDDEFDDSEDEEDDEDPDADDADDFEDLDEDEALARTHGGDIDGVDIDDLDDDPDVSED